MFLTEDEDLMG